MVDVTICSDYSFLSFSFGFYHGGKMFKHAITPARAYYNQRNKLKELTPTIRAMGETIDRLSDMGLYQWAQITAFTLEYKPDLIIELGRGYGNSTCFFTECANEFGGKDSCEVHSFCLARDFEDVFLPKLKEDGIVAEGWDKPLTLYTEDLIKFDFTTLIDKAQRVLVFWDAHGYDIADKVLGDILPYLYEQKKEHQLLMHDITDLRHNGTIPFSYDGELLWRNNNSTGRLALGHMQSCVEQCVAITDFTSRNGIFLESADHTYHSELTEAQQEEMLEILGSEFFNMSGHWFFISLNDFEGPFAFPGRKGLI